MSGLSAGAAKVSITPGPDMFPVPISTKTDFGVAPIITTGPYDDMDCRALALRYDEEELLLLVYELGGHPPIADLEEQLAEATGFPADRIVVAATHNHTAGGAGGGVKKLSPELASWTEENTLLLQNAGIRAAKEAVSSLRPARYGYGETQSYVNVNRDLQTLGGFWVEGRNLAGYSDKTLQAVKFVDEDGNLIAALLDYGCHNTCCYMMRDADHEGKTSGNMSGVACRFVEEHYGNGAVCLWVSGAAGDQNPLLSHGLQYEYPDGYTSAVSYPDGIGFMMMEYLGRTHGADAVRCLDGIDCETDRMPMLTSGCTVGLVAQKRADGEDGSGQPVRQGGLGLRPEGEAAGVVAPPVLPQMEEDPSHTNPMDMKLFVLGDIAVIFTNGEMYAKLGTRMKERSPYKKTLLVTHALPGRTGYILDEESKDHTVFQAFGPNKPGASDGIILEGVSELFRKAL